jgi:hypothetical protein
MSNDLALRSAALAAALAFCAYAPAQFLPRVALCGAASTSSTACQWTDVQTRLVATGAFSAVDIINVTTSGVGTPTLESLLQYDALLCWTNSTPADNNTWGDVLADYVDAGGGVVVAVFANSTLTAGRNIGGRWQLGYEVILDQTGNTGGAASLGNVPVAGHPVMNGVVAFQGGTTGSRPTGTALEVGSFVIAEWSDGKILVAQGANANRIDLGFYPPNATCSQSGWVTGGDQLMTNALLFVAEGGRFGPYGAGCAGTLGVPTFGAQPGSRPVLGTTFAADIGNLPFAVAVVAAGTSRDAWGALPLPLSLVIVGAPGCDLLAEPLVTTAVFGAGNTATWSLPVPLVGSLIGAELFAQAFSLDPGANMLGFAGSNGGLIKIGT